MPDEAQIAAEEAVADAIFGPEEQEYEPNPEPVVEGDDEPDEVVEEPEEQPDDEDPIVEFEWQGQLIEAPTSIKESLMLQKDYTQKTQDVSIQRKELEIQSENLKMVNSQYEFAQNVQTDIIKAHGLEQQITEAKEYLRNNVGQGQDLSATQIEQIRIAISDAQDQRDSIITDVTSRNTEFQQAQEQTRTELLNKGTEVLRSKVPGWGDEHEGKIKDYALSLGVPETTFNSIVDPLEKEVLWKASQYDALQQGKGAAVKTVQNAPTIKPKSRNPMPKDTQDKLNLRKKLKSNASPQDKAAAITKDLERLF